MSPNDQTIQFRIKDLSNNQLDGWSVAVGVLNNQDTFLVVVL